MNNIPRTYYASWHSPDREHPLRPFDSMGVLYYYGDKKTVLTIISGARSRSGVTSMYCHYDVLFGEDANGFRFTLFNVNMINQQLSVDFSQTDFTVDYILLGCHIRSLDTKCFNKCIIKFPYLRDWAFQNNCKCNRSIAKGTMEWEYHSPSLVKTELKDGTQLSISSHLQEFFTKYENKIQQDSVLIINTTEDKSIGYFLQRIIEFSQFLSIALFGYQSPIDIVFENPTSSIRTFQLLFEQEVSVKREHRHLIKYSILKERLSAFWGCWHSNYEQMAPISNYLTRSLRNLKEFDISGFLIIAQSLDGFFKRFVNKKDGKNTTQYEQQIKKLLEHFQGIQLLKQCNLNATVLTHSRHKYSHLIPDGDTKNVEKAVEGEELYCLTHKSIVLLTCCILDNLGLTIDEINVCLKDSAVEDLVENIPFWYKE